VGGVAIDCGPAEEWRRCRRVGGAAVWGAGRADAFRSARASGWAQRGEGSTDKGQRKVEDGVLGAREGQVAGGGCYGAARTLRGRLVVDRARRRGRARVVSGRGVEGVVGGGRVWVCWIMEFSRFLMRAIAAVWRRGCQPGTPSRPCGLADAYGQAMLHPACV